MIGKMIQQINTASPVAKPMMTIVNSPEITAPITTMIWKFSACAAWRRMKGSRSL